MCNEELLRDERLLMRAQCNNTQYLPDDGGFYPKYLTLLQLHTYFRKGGPVGTKLPNSDNGGELQSKTPTSVASREAAGRRFPMFGGQRRNQFPL